MSESKKSKSGKKVRKFLWDESRANSHVVFLQHFRAATRKEIIVGIYLIYQLKTDKYKALPIRDTALLTSTTDSFIRDMLRRLTNVGLLLAKKSVKPSRNVYKLTEQPDAWNRLQ